MDEAVKRVLALCSLLACGVQAQPLQDPTRPPAQLLHPVAGARVDAAPQVQSILVGRGAGGRRVAVIDGETVRVGDLVHGARVTGITATTVTLQRGNTRDVLTLTEQGTK